MAKKLSGGSLNSSSLHSRLKRIVGLQLFLPITAMAAVVAFSVFVIPNFLEFKIVNGVFYGYIIDVVNRASELVILALGMTLVAAASAGADISVGAVSAVSGAVCIVLLRPEAGIYKVDSYAVPYMVAIVVGCLVGAACGAWNGFLVSRLRIQPMVATLILFTAGRGFAQLLTDGQQIAVNVPSFQYLGFAIPGVPIHTPILVTGFFVFITWFVLRKLTTFGLYIQSVGINSKASRVVGLKSKLIIFLAYLFCGLCAGIAGMIATSRVHNIDANNAGLYWELDAILAVALGGNSLGGGKFSLAGSVIGAYTIQLLTTSLYALQVPADQLYIYKAIVIIIIVSLQSPELAKLFRSRRIRSTISQSKEVAAR